ncbi:hypothetical protein [Candidatus Ishikawella capsulata]|nr:hypothetical protein [Candidatus Ishikawaella capsulata]
MHIVSSCFIKNPRLLVLDEHHQGIDINNQILFSDFIDQLCQE